MNAETASRLIKTLRQITEALEQLLPAVSHHPTCKVSKGGVKCNCRVHAAVVALQQGKEVLDLSRSEEIGADWVLGAMKEKAAAPKAAATPPIRIVPQIIEPRSTHGVNWGAPAPILLQPENGPWRLVWRGGYLDSHRGERTYHRSELQLRGIDQRGKPDLIGFDFNDVIPKDEPAKMTQHLLTLCIQRVVLALGYASIGDIPFNAVTLYQAFKSKRTIILLD